MESLHAHITEKSRDLKESDGGVALSKGLMLSWLEGGGGPWDETEG